jgi:RNA polymerase sigma factor (sigma-70 family)
MARGRMIRPVNAYPVDRPFWSGLLRKIAHRTRGRDDAEDLLHAAFIRLERYRANNTVKNPGAFLVQTAVNIGIDRYRHEQLYSEPTTESQWLDLPDQAPGPDEIVDAHLVLDRVKSGLAQLSPRTREIFLMHRLDNMKYREIAVRLGVTQSAVEKHIAKAALFLAEWMED